LITGGGAFGASQVVPNIETTFAQPEVYAVGYRASRYRITYSRGGAGFIYPANLWTEQYKSKTEALHAET
jgi:hypothetical protein